MIQEISAGAIGIIIGVLTGLAPGIHINLVSALVVTLIPHSNIEPISAAIFIAVLAITHTAIDFIPSIYLGAPNDETALTVLPSHELLKGGQGHQAVSLALKGTLAGAVIAIGIAPLIILFSPKILSMLSGIIPFIIIFLITYLLMRENKIVAGIMTFILSGILGYLALNTPVKEPLLPLLSGLFGASGLVMSMKEKTSLTKQNTEAVISANITKKDLIAYTGIGSIFSILPALGSGYASLVSSEIKENDSKKFIYSVGLMNMLIMVSSFSFVYATRKARTGAAAATLELLNKQTPVQITTILSVCLVASILAFFIGKAISKKSAEYISKIRYDIVSGIALGIMALMTILFSNLLGIIVFLTGAAIGIFTITSGVRRTTMMGCLIVPTLIYYLT